MHGLGDRAPKPPSWRAATLSDLREAGMGQTKARPAGVVGVRHVHEKSVARESGTPGWSRWEPSRSGELDPSESTVEHLRAEGRREP